MIQVIGKNTVRSSTSIRICFLITDKDIERLLLLGDSEDSFLNFIDSFCFRFIDTALCEISVFKCGFIVFIGKDGCILNPIHRWNPLMCCWIFDIFNTITAKN